MALLATGPVGDARLADRRAPRRPRRAAAARGPHRRPRRSRPTAAVRTSLVRSSNPTARSRSIPPVGAPRLVAWLRSPMAVATVTPGPRFTVPRRRASSAGTHAGRRRRRGRLAARARGCDWHRRARRVAPTPRPCCRSGRVPSTAAAGLRRERIRSLRSDPAFAGRRPELDKPFVGKGAPVRGGRRARVVTLPNSRFDRAKSGRRSSSADRCRRGSSASTAAVSRSPRLPARRTTGGGGLAQRRSRRRRPAQATASCPKAPSGSPCSAATVRPAASPAGWPTAPLVQVDERTYLGAGCVVLATSPSTRRRHGRVTHRDRAAAAKPSRRLVGHDPAADGGTLRTVVVLLDGCGRRRCRSCRSAAPRRPAANRSWCSSASARRSSSGCASTAGRRSVTHRRRARPRRRRRPRRPHRRTSPQLAERARCRRRRPADGHGRQRDRRRFDGGRDERSDDDAAPVRVPARPPGHVPRRLERRR